MNMSVINFITPTRPAQAYATIQNAKLNPTANDFMTFKDRLAGVLSTNKRVKKMEWAIAQVRARFPHWKTWQDMRLPEAQQIAVSFLLIDTTLQREVDFDHLIKIISNFNPLVVQALCIYILTADDTKIKGLTKKQRKELKSLWEGQHTGLAIYAIAKFLFGMEDDSQILLPCAVYPAVTRTEMRDANESLNSGGRKPWEANDHHRSNVMAYRVDGSRREKDEVSDLKQRALEKVGMFTTGKAADDKEEIGAFSNLAEFDKDYSVPVHTAFARMIAELDGGVTVNRSVNGKISYQLYDYLDLCESQGIQFTDEFFVETATALNMGYKVAYNADTLHELAQASCRKFYQIAQKTNDPKYGYEAKKDDICFMIAQINNFITDKSLVPVPGSKYGRFTVDPTDCDE
jgi:hypothetical protein